MATGNTLTILGRRRALWAIAFGLLFLGSMMFGDWVLDKVGWAGYAALVVFGAGIIVALELRLTRVCCPDCGQYLERNPGGTPSQYRCPRCGVVWDTEFRKAG